jgi:pimeloyl-ACP methyl ester carboxylesterase
VVRRSKLVEGLPDAGKRHFIFVAVASFSLIVASLWHLSALKDGVGVETLRVGLIPVSVFRSKYVGLSPTVVIAHGFAGSQQLMQPMALSLARNGYIAVTFDFAGHGLNTEPMPGGLKDVAKSTAALLGEIERIVAFAKSLPGGDNRVALVGHSMASELVVQYAMAHPAIPATVALSVFGRETTAVLPKNLLVIDGAWEPNILHDAARRIVGMATGISPKEHVTYGDMSRGTARRYVFAASAEHIGVIYSRDALTETIAWLDAVFHRQSSGWIDRRGLWLAGLFGGVITFAYPLARLLPSLSPRSLGAGLPWRLLLPVGLGPAVLTPLFLWKAPTDFLPILLGDYLVVHFALYGALTVAGLWFLRARGPSAKLPTIPKVPFLVASAALAAFYIFAFGLPLDAYVTSLKPTGVRLLLIPTIFCGTAIYFLADEWLTRGIGAGRGGYAFTKVCFIGSLAIAIALDPRRLFFLAIVAPVILLFFIVYGTISAWAYGKTRDPRAAALAAAVSLAWAIAATFPIVG